MFFICLAPTDKFQTSGVYGRISAGHHSKAYRAFSSSFACPGPLVPHPPSGQCGHSTCLWGVELLSVSLQNLVFQVVVRDGFRVFSGSQSHFREPPPTSCHAKEFHFSRCQEGKSVQQMSDWQAGGGKPPGGWELPHLLLGLQASWWPSGWPLTFSPASAHQGQSLGRCDSRAAARKLTSTQRLNLNLPGPARRPEQGLEWEGPWASLRSLDLRVGFALPWMEFCPVLLENALNLPLWWRKLRHKKTNYHGKDEFPDLRSDFLHCSF